MEWGTSGCDRNNPDAYIPEWQDIYERIIGVGIRIYSSYRPYYHFEMRLYPNGYNISWNHSGTMLIAQNTTVWQWVTINCDDDFPV